MMDLERVPALLLRRLRVKVSVVPVIKVTPAPSGVVAKVVGAKSTSLIQSLRSKCGHCDYSLKHLVPLVSLFVTVCLELQQRAVGELYVKCCASGHDQTGAFEGKLLPWLLVVWVVVILELIIFSARHLRVDAPPPTLP